VRLIVARRARQGDRLFPKRRRHVRAGVQFGSIKRPVCERKEGGILCLWERIQSVPKLSIIESSVYTKGQNSHSQQVPINNPLHHRGRQFRQWAPFDGGKSTTETSPDPVREKVVVVRGTRREQGWEPAGFILASIYFGAEVGGASGSISSVPEAPHAPMAQPIGGADSPYSRDRATMGQPPDGSAFTFYTRGYYLGIDLFYSCLLPYGRLCTSLRWKSPFIATSNTSSSRERDSSDTSTSDS
jgi:hypothetical protein